MAKYKFDEIAINSRAKKKPTEEDRHTYIGLEHLDSGNLQVTRFGSDVAPIGEKLLMKKGDVLFGKRRAYQKKVGIAPFDGIFSAHGVVLRPNEKIINKEFFPFFISSDYFLDAAIKISVGSLSPTINWSDLKELSFNLPSLKEQEKLAKVLWTAEATRQNYKNLLTKTDELVKSKFIDMFGEISQRKNRWNITPISEIIEKPLSGEWGKDDPYNEGIKVIRTTNFTDYGVINYDNVTTRIIDDKKANAKFLKSGDVLIEKSGGSDTKPVGRVVLYEGADNEFLFNNFTSVIRAKDNNFINAVFLFKFLFINYSDGNTRPYNNKTTGIHNLKLTEYLNDTIIPVPPITLQQKFADFVLQTEKSKEELQKSLDSLNAMTKALINENLK